MGSRYRIVRFVGRGPIGEVFEAEDLELGINVGLKAIHERWANSENAVLTIKRAVAATRGIHHRLVGRIYDLTRYPSPSGDLLLLTMDLLDGQSLAARLAMTGRLATTDALPLVEQIVRALGAAHELGIVHGNLKPTNIVVDGEAGVGRAIVTDFGLALPMEPEARSSAVLTRQGGKHVALIAPRSYLAPEQLAGEQPGRAADVYSLGIVMYEMVTGRHPFAADANGRQAAEPRPPSRWVSDLDPKWDAAIVRCLRPDLEERSQGVADIIDALGPPMSVPMWSQRIVPADSGQEPEVTVGTLVMTDLIDSTKLVDTLGDQRAAEVFADHDRLARDLLPPAGLEIDRTDGFLFLFDRPSIGVAYALEYQRRLRELSEELGVALHARVGIHMGEVRLRRNTRAHVARGAKAIELEGLTKPTVARLTSLARGGQTLLSKGAFDLAKRANVGVDTAGAEIRWLAHGKYRVKGVEEPIEVFEVGVEGRAPLTPPPNSEKAHRIAGPPSRSRRAATLAIASACVAMVTVGATLFVRSRNEVPRPLASRRLTSAPGWEAEPAISPDGSLVAYASDEGGHADIWIVDPQGTGTLRLTDDAADHRTPAWFPDNNAIAFSSNRGGKWGIWKTSRLGGSPTPLVENARDPAISPDGRSIAFARADNDLFRIWVAPLDDPTHAVKLTTEADGLGEHRHPAWRPDGSEIAFQDFAGLWLVSVHGGRPRALATSRKSSSPAWSSDGRSVYFSTNHDNTSAVWRAPVEGEAPTRVTMGTGPEVQPNISRDGARLAYSTFAPTDQLVLLDLVTKVRTQIPTTVDEEDIAITADAQRIAFWSKRRGGVGLWTQKLADLRPMGEPQRITELSFARSAFSPDGRWIAGHVANGRQLDIWIVRVDGGVPRRFTEGSGTNVHPAWSPDGAEIAFASDAGGVSQIWIAPVADGQRAGDARRLTSGPPAKYVPAWSPDGSRVAFIGTEEDQDEIWITELKDGTRPRRLTAGAHAASLRWGLGEDELFVSGTWGGPSTLLKRVSASTGETATVDPDMRFGNASGGAVFDVSRDAGIGAFFDVSRQGHTLVARFEESRGDIWLLEAKPGSY